VIDVGLIGFGLAGRAFHAPVIARVPGLRLAAILQRSGSEAAQLYPDARIVRNVDELLAAKDIRLVVIATPNDTHYSLARQGLAAGRHVVVDKPFTPTLQEASDLVQLARQSGRLLTVYQNRRFDGDFQALREIVASGALGRIVRFETNYDRFRPQLKTGAWRERGGPGSGILFDLAPHLIDQALLLFGLPEAITADIRIEREHAVADDAFDLTLHYSRDLRAVLRATMLAATLRPRFLVHGTEGAYVKHAFDVQEPKLRAGRIPWEETPTAAEREENSGVLTLAHPDGTTSERRVPPAQSDYRDFYANVRDAMLGSAELAVTPQHALNVMRVLELARESSSRRCAVRWQQGA
jgi:scyllo-inositol 2-dehydrogenase (NADP+)